MAAKRDGRGYEDPGPALMDISADPAHVATQLKLIEKEKLSIIEPGI